MFWMTTRPSWSTIPKRSPSASVAIPKSHPFVRTRALSSAMFSSVQEGAIPPKYGSM